ncbi:hypothetical protein Godav_018740 [Gossypium davidsonii]|uniref:Uncharacterized protein n=1 Tax=Gossypium davidsonii TaxID=34287 RepID=A0A7J8QYN0_GOSDV|nr:hypothetical protein [Gossypium davidsonii]
MEGPLPQSLLNCKELEVLDVALKPKLFPMLRIMDISHNEFIGSLPTRFFKNLKAMLSVGRNELREVQYVGQKDFYSQWDDVVRVTTHLASLTHLHLSYSSLSGLVPQEISHLSKLVSLDLSGNDFGVDMSHVAPLTLANLSSSLVSLHLETCYLGEAHGG